jgi:hypothetical protein
MFLENSHSHTPHAVAHLLKHPDPLTAFTAAASVISDLVQKLNPSEGEPVLNIYLERPEIHKDGVLDYNSFHMLFEKVKPNEIAPIIKLFGSDRFSVNYTPNSPFAEALHARRAPAP